MEFFADYHTHTTYSDGHGTIADNAEAARQAGLDTLGIADHGPANIGVGVKGAGTYLDIKKEIEEVRGLIPDIEILLGAEANVTGTAGEIDLPGHVLAELDFLIIGLHPYVWAESIGDFAQVVLGNGLASYSKGLQKKIRVSNTKSLIECIYKHEPFCISHPDLKMPVEVGELARHCVKKDVKLELNTGHHYDKNKLIEEALPTGVDFVVSSDAHFPETVGRLLEGALLLDSHNVPIDRVSNARQ